MRRTVEATRTAPRGDLAYWSWTGERLIAKVDYALRSVISILVQQVRYLGQCVEAQRRVTRGRRLNTCSESLKCVELEKCWVSLTPLNRDMQWAIRGQSSTVILFKHWPAFFIYSLSDKSTNLIRHVVGGWERRGGASARRGLTFTWIVVAFLNVWISQEVNYERGVSWIRGV